MSFPAYRKVFSKVTTKTSLKLLDAYPLAEDLLAAPKETVVETIRSTARFGEKYALARYDALRTAAEDAAIFGRALKSNSVRIRLYIDSYREYQKRLDTIMEAIHATVDGLKDSPIYGRILLLQSLRGVGFMSAVVLVAEMGSFDLFPSPKKLYAYFGLDPAVKQSGKFNGDKVHMSKGVLPLCFLLQTPYFQGLHHFFKRKSNDPPLFCVNTITNPQTLKGKSLLMDIIPYLLSLIQFLYQQNCWLINFICRYIPLGSGPLMIPIPQNTRSSRSTNSPCH